MAKINIQGIECVYRDLREGESILYENLPQNEQIFKRTNHPFTDEELIDIANKEHQYTPLQKSWKEEQEKIFKNGLYAYINGVLRFIPGAYWCYINFWTLEHGEKPEYREDDRLFFLFHEYLRLETPVLAATRLKGRRQGATSIAMFFMWYVGGREEHKLCGLTSFDDSAAQIAFQNMFMYGFKSMLPCFQADFDSDSENFIRFVKPVDKKNKNILAVAREGLNSRCDYKSNVITSYDSGRQSYNVPDEGGKRKKLNINSYWSRLYKTLLIGSNKVGFAYLPTTVGSKDEGGENYKIFWNNSSQFEIDPETGEPVGVNTINRCVQYFVPGTNCYAGYVDVFGNSIVEDPEIPVLTNEGKWVSEGARTVILRERKRLSGEQLMEHRRDYPLDIHDAFAFETGQCEFDEDALIKRIEFLQRNPEVSYWRRCRMTEEVDESGRIVAGISDDPKGDVWIYKEPPMSNKYIKQGRILIPDNVLFSSAGADTYRNIFAVNGSKGVICVTEKSNIVDGIETGLKPIAFFIGRPNLITTFNRQAFLLCLYYGCKINYESDAGTWFFEDFSEWGALSFLEWTPARDLSNPNFKIKPGTESANPFQLAKQLEVAKIYFDGTKKELRNGNTNRVTFIPLLEQALAYNHSERTPYDIMVAFQMSLLPMYGQPKKPPMPQRMKAIMPTYKIKIPA